MPSEVERLIDRGSLQRVSVDDAAADRLLGDATLHLNTAESAIGAGDLSGAYQLAYDAARKSLTALLLFRGLRAKGQGAHATLIGAVGDVCADTEGVRVVARLDRMRRLRNQTEYFGQELTESQVRQDLELAREIVVFAQRQCPS